MSCREAPLQHQIATKATLTGAANNQNLNRTSPVISVASVNVLKVFLPVKGHYAQYFPLSSPFPATSSQNVLLL